jgi:predicted small secreted protein
MCANAQNIAGERRISVARNQANTEGHFALGFYDRRFKMIRKIIASLLATLFFAGLFGTLAGCNTIEGAGLDIQQGGKAIKDEAREQKNKM